MNNLSSKQRFVEGDRVRLVRAQSDVEVISYGHRNQRRDYPAGCILSVCDTMRDIVLVRDYSVIFWVNQKDLEEVVCAE